MIFRVRRKHGSSKRRPCITFRYNLKGDDWSEKELEELDSFQLIFAESLTPDEIAKLKEKWKHKLNKGLL